MSFDASTFLNQTVDGPMSTNVPTVPEGEYRMIVSSDGSIEDWFSEASWTDKNGNKQSAPTVTIPVEILDDNLRQKLGRDKVTSRIKMFLDMSGGKLDTSEGKNVKLGALRKAVGQNEMTGWNFALLRGAGPFMGRVTQTSDKKDPEVKYSEVTRVSKLA